MSSTNTQFDAAFLQSVKEKLEQDKVRIQEELNNITRKNPDTGENEADFPDYGNEVDDDVAEVEEYTINKPLKISLEKQIRDIDKTIARIEAGTYGICKYCDKPIDEKRLEARPTSSACVECKKMLTDEA